MVTICLLRHGETVYNADGNKYCGRADIELTDKGIRQAKRMNDLLKEYTFDAVFSSPLKRAKDTAAIASGKPAEVVVDERLIEVDRKIVQENSSLTLLTLSQEDGMQLLKLNA